MLQPLEAKTIEYPESDGEPMGETGFHVTLIAYLLGMLRAFFQPRGDVYIGGNMFLYYEEGNPRKCVSPDLFLVFGVAPQERRSWFVWEEGAVPAVVFEFTSRATKAEDEGTKKELYERLGVQEYFLFDPLNHYLKPPLKGYRLVAGQYAPIALEAGGMSSEVLGLRLQPAGTMLDLFDNITGERLLPQPELVVAFKKALVAWEAAEDALQEAEGALQEEALARQQAEIARQEAEAARQAAEAARQQAEAERQQEALARQQAEAERQQAEAEVARLRAALAKYRGAEENEQ
jgi:Uma2 family endonuclease